METTFLYAPDDEVEARAIEALLRDAGLRFSIRANADTAYPGVLDTGRGWGEIRVHPDDLDDAQNLVADWLESEPIAGEPVETPRPIEPSRPERTVVSLLPWAVLAISLLANWYQWDRHRLRLGEQDVHDAEGRVVAKYVFRDSVDFAPFARVVEHDHLGSTLHRSRHERVARGMLLLRGRAPLAR